MVYCQYNQRQDLFIRKYSIVNLSFRLSVTCVKKCQLPRRQWLTPAILVLRRQRSEGLRFEVRLGK
jgi:hypothetical protein